MTGRLTDGKEGIIRIINRINSRHHENGKIISAGVGVGAFETISGSVEIDDILVIQGTGSGLGISGCGQVLPIPAPVAPLADGISGYGESGGVGGIEPELEAINLRRLEGTGFEKGFFRNHGEQD